MFFTAQILLNVKVPEALTIRETSYSWIVGLSLFCCLALLAFARTRQNNIYATISLGMLKGQSLRSFIRDEMPVRSGGSLLLLLNYLISTGIVVFLLADYHGVARVDAWLFASIVPGALLFFHLFSLLFSGWITGEPEPFRAPIVMKIVGAQALGVFYFVCATFWVLQPDYVEFIVDAATGAFLIENAWRILKSVLVVIRQGVIWYYIILYFCTLEILPLLVFYYYGLQFFSD